MIATKKKITWRQVIAKLDALEGPSIEEQHTLAWGVSFLLEDRAFLDHHKGDLEAMSKRIDKYVELYPGMTRTLLCEMYKLYPNLSDWRDLKVSKIHAAALVSVGKRQNAPREAEEGDEEKPKQGRPTAKRLAELEIERDRERLARLEKEAEAVELKNQLREAQQRIGELEMELHNMRRRLESAIA